MTSPAIHSPQWFDKHLADAPSAIPGDLRSFSEAICTTFNIKGICDPLYIINCAAFELGRGDGKGHFHEQSLEAKESLSARLQKLTTYLAFAYSSSIAGETVALQSLVHEHLSRPSWQERLNGQQPS